MVLTLCQMKICCMIRRLWYWRWQQIKSLFGFFKNFIGTEGRGNLRINTILLNEFFYAYLNFDHFKNLSEVKTS